MTECVFFFSGLCRVSLSLSFLSLSFGVGLCDNSLTESKFASFSFAGSVHLHAGLILDPFLKREIKPKIGCIMMKIIGHLISWKQNLTNYMETVNFSVKITRNVLNCICLSQ